MLDSRRAKVLEALIEEYIRTGGPVSSAAILEHSELEVSSATIRNDLARLESYGFVTQPHTSAGRVPTEQGYRYYVDHRSPAKLRSSTRARIDQFFSEVNRELGDLLKETSGLLSDITSLPAVVIGPGFASEVVVGSHVVPLSSGACMLVLVGQTGRVIQEVVRTPVDMSRSEHGELEAAIEDVFVGGTVNEGAQLCIDANAGASERVLQCIATVGETLVSAAGGTPQVHVGGASQLAALWEDLAHVHRVLRLLDHQAGVYDVLGEEEGISVRFGISEDQDAADVAVISASYVAGGESIGHVGVIGPTRMNYRRTIKVVEEIGEGLAEQLGS
jgi:heat-inducible transcriptional repressor